MLTHEKETYNTCTKSTRPNFRYLPLTLNAWITFCVMQIHRNNNVSTCMSSMILIVLSLWKGKIEVKSSVLT